MSEGGDRDRPDGPASSSSPADTEPLQTEPGRPRRAPEPTLVRFRKARRAFEDARLDPREPASFAETGSIRQRFALRVPEPPKARRSLFRRLLITTLAVLAIYGGLTQLLAYRLGANVLAEAFQEQLVNPALVALQDSIGSMLVSSPSDATIQTFLEQRYGAFPRMTVAVYSTEGLLLGEHVGQPGAPPEQLPAALDVGALQTHHQRHAQLHLLDRGEHALGDEVARHDAAEDVHEDRLHVRVR